MKRLLSKIDKTFGLAGSAIGFGGCAALNLAVFAFTWFVLPVLSLLFLFVYIVLFIPFMFFSFMLTRKLIKDTKSRSRLLNFVYKPVAVLLICFTAFFPFSLFGIQALFDMPAENAKKNEASEFRETVLNSETYADLTPFGFGIYKRIKEGDQYIWDITDPKSHPSKNTDGTYSVFERFPNHKDISVWDTRNEGKDAVYNVFYYEGKYLIVPPGQNQLIYICEEISENADLYYVAVYNGTDKIEKLRELPGEQYSRQEIIEKLGKYKKSDSK